ncbi:2-succinyl-5-enolpyruvyl-6-hydroxy-3-cyclohexene-1-carboxylic-acid synthase [uncultured Serinicoccus sp.]|uniref:2-succinyl-5-enolpyruvyl-6-hydroxy-3- cyclohexene-1-carboxylic-acid synthase n=1 Tax=uncultured Serinicoccus sp. TaxID=735514 RepID=UPI00262FB831|nr:2-succinyl-5-enolpyruvyl-6-hydroxy-3-cyclohexene-1-carboxylic-acid synthase [uncultured Serinicoccus sp.]
MHPSTALATVLVDELVRGGVREAVLAPGSRSAPLAYALEEADRAGRLRLHVRIDERSAGFLALGLARGSGAPVAVVTTSGTAVANLHPAVLEASHSGIPLVVLSADRPAELRGTGANQTTVQPGIFAGAVRWEVDLPAPEAVTPGAGAHWRSTVCRALAAARGAGPVAGAGAGPVHLNVSFRDPLAPVPVPAAGADDLLAGRASGVPWVTVAPVPAARPAPLAPGHRTLVLLGDLPDPASADRALSWAQEAGWPVLAEPFGRLPTGPGVVPHGPLLAAAVARGELTELLPERVVVVGRLTLFRELGALLRLPGVVVEHVSAHERWTDPSHVVSRVHGPGALVAPPRRHTEASSWVHAWTAAGEALAGRVAAAAGTEPTGVGVARVVAGALGAGDVLVLGSSTVPRDLAVSLDGTAAAARVVANRGLAGIDGTVATAVGVALAVQGGEPPTGPPRVLALMGDLTFLHDAGGLVIGPGEPRPDLTVVVVNDDGGGIFSTLEYGDPDRLASPTGAAAAERVFGTPHGTDLGALCAAHGVPHERLDSLGALEERLAERAEGLRVLEVPVDRATHRRVRDALR